MWMPKTIKLDLVSSIPEEIYDKIATEEDALNPIDLRQFLKSKKHPITERYWKNGEPVPVDLPGAGEMWPGDQDYSPVAEAVGDVTRLDDGTGTMVLP